MQANLWDNIEKIKKNGRDGAVSEKDLQEAQDLLSPEQKQKMNRVLNDPNALQELLASPAAKALLERLNANGADS